MNQRAHLAIFFTGRVQGVGFRYSTLQVAKEFEVSGFVTNLPDGRVQLVAEGLPREVEAFVAMVQERMHGYIRKVEQETLPAGTVYKGFAIK